MVIKSKILIFEGITLNNESTWMVIRGKLWLAIEALGVVDGEGKKIS